jgi:hypothetical protein
VFIRPSAKHLSQKTKMECFRYGFDFPSIQNRAVVMSKPRIRFRPRYRYRHHHKLPVEPLKIPLKIYTPPPTFSIELHNMFEILDI